MTLDEIKNKLKTDDYNFLKENKHLGNNIALLGLGGSHAYGTNNENSDLDIRGIATNTADEILLRKDFNEVVDVPTDTTIYSFNKMIELLCSCNPNTIEILGLKPEHYLYVNDVGKLILANKTIFLSQIAIAKFGGYANGQLRRLQNKSARFATQKEFEENIKKSIEFAEKDFMRDLNPIKGNDYFELFVDNSEKEDLDSEIFCNIHLEHYPLRDFQGIERSMNNVIKSYNKMGARNKKAIAHDKLGKHMMHLIRLYIMCFDIVERGEIKTYRDKEHDFLMSIRNGKYLDENKQVLPEFFEIVDECENHLEYLKTHNDLPKSPDRTKVNKLIKEVNEIVVVNNFNNRGV